MSVKPEKPVTLIKNAATAPVVFADSAPALGYSNGIVEVTLTSRLLLPRSDNTVTVEQTAAAHLRLSLAGAQSLREALDKAIGMADLPAIKLAS